MTEEDYKFRQGRRKEQVEGQHNAKDAEDIEKAIVMLGSFGGLGADDARLWSSRRCAAPVASRKQGPSQTRMQ